MVRVAMAYAWSVGHQYPLVSGDFLSHMMRFGSAPRTSGVANNHTINDE